jgi:hypothetical protein
MSIKVTKTVAYKIVARDGDYFEVEPNDYNISVYERSSYDNSITQSYEISYDNLDEMIEVLQAIQKERDSL